MEQDAWLTNGGDRYDRGQSKHECSAAGSADTAGSRLGKYCCLYNLELVHNYGVPPHFALSVQQYLGQKFGSR